MTNEIAIDTNLIAKCGLYCGACKAYLKGKCPGCASKTNANWCGVRKCCIENSYQSCADCKKMELEDCKDLNNFMAKIFAFIFKSDRHACLKLIREIGYDQFAKNMAENKLQTIRRK